mmetsp:Transcript_11445/g.13063  ORF Transcript_11445/g.13063 Transcript_11445/m.13063 type:complete len:454 (-) Transcript_11445:1167-2528(-)|eukprot:CAMPEP_0204823906 /NCGR_PEP_ID=MMETSP1346-20131115/1986_1 /ASSEMBLY_ACC=CAM_ASM_000771 /TAXON_ID=215587 /ORGANISM="Aplanochytrium stocchinoi, Strain GSBS06" /LENGTH=453 /DNA_ID=CAMNT_0051950785 /DNA_START=332 /DNA_END=1693 /DNA_ORIENTATION=+
MELHEKSKNSDDYYHYNVVVKDASDQQTPLRAAQSMEFSRENIDLYASSVSDTPGRNRRGSMETPTSHLHHSPPGSTTSHASTIISRRASTLINQHQSHSLTKGSLNFEGLVKKKDVVNISILEPDIKDASSISTSTSNKKGGQHSHSHSKSYTSFRARSFQERHKRSYCCPCSCTGICTCCCSQSNPIPHPYFRSFSHPHPNEDSSWKRISIVAFAVFCVISLLAFVQYEPAQIFITNLGSSENKVSVTLSYEGDLSNNLKKTNSDVGNEATTNDKDSNKHTKFQHGEGKHKKSKSNYKGKGNGNDKDDSYLTDEMNMYSDSDNDSSNRNGNADRDDSDNEKSKDSNRDYGNLEAQLERILNSASSAMFIMFGAICIALAILLWRHQKQKAYLDTVNMVYADKGLGKVLADASEEWRSVSPHNGQLQPTNMQRQWAKQKVKLYNSNSQDENT